MYYEKITFFRPEEKGRERSSLRADVYNRCRLLLSRSSCDCQFVPIRSMQYQGVITRDEVIFVDAQDYAVRDGEGGRTIVSAWQFDQGGGREALNEPVAMDIVHYHPRSAELRFQLPVEFAKALIDLLERQAPVETTPTSVKVVDIRP